MVYGEGECRMTDKATLLERLEDAAERVREAGFRGHGTVCKAIAEAVEALKAQETRVLTLEEVRTAEDCMEPVFLEMNAERETPDVFSWRTVKHITPLFDKDIYVLDNVGFSSALYSEWYGMSWRCWNKRPTYEQQKAVKWDD